MFETFIGAFIRDIDARLSGETPVPDDVRRRLIERRRHLEELAADLALAPGPKATPIDPRSIVKNLMRPALTLEMFLPKGKK